jgi:aspartyl-tRNA(Asn)/glutamyl-tRNA(Gln) amidotransferase subunit A
MIQLENSVMQLQPPPAETILGVSQALRARELTCVSVVEQCLAQIDAWEPRVYAWVSIDREGALARARELDCDLTEGRLRGPLHGIPLGIKDLFDVTSRPTLAGAPWLPHVAATADAPVVARLRKAGAIILGKTVTTQFACFDPPETRNPWNLARTPGGSSSGSAAAVATGMCLGAIGSQTGGSITRPASFCGVAGCKPTFGLVSLEGVYPLACSLDHAGPIARSVADLALLLEVMAEQPIASPIPCEPPRLGRLRGMFDERAEPASLSVFEDALRVLARAGATVSEATLPATFRDVLDCHRVLMTVELAALHERMLVDHRRDYLPCVRGLIEEGLQVPATRYARTKRHQAQLCRDMAEAFGGADVLACPATIGPAPTLETTGSPAFNSCWSYTGLPVVSFPIGLSPDGLPLSMQLVGRAHDESTLFAVAEWCERQVGPT